MDVNYSFNPHEVKEIIKIKEQNKKTHTHTHKEIIIGFQLIPLEKT